MKHWSFLNSRFRKDKKEVDQEVCEIKKLLQFNIGRSLRDDEPLPSTLSPKDIARQRVKSRDVGAPRPLAPPRGGVGNKISKDLNLSMKIRAMNCVKVEVMNMNPRSGPHSSLEGTSIATEAQEYTPRKGLGNKAPPQKSAEHNEEATNDNRDAPATADEAPSFPAPSGAPQVYPGTFAASQRISARSPDEQTKVPHSEIGKENKDKMATAIAEQLKNENAAGTRNQPPSPIRTSKRLTVSIPEPREV